MPAGSSAAPPNVARKAGSNVGVLALATAAAHRRACGVPLALLSVQLGFLPRAQKAIYAVNLENTGGWKSAVLLCWRIMFEMNHTTTGHPS